MRKDFALCFNDGYVPYANVTIKSIADSMPSSDDVHIHIISDYLSDTHKTLIERTAPEATVCFYIVNADDALFADLPVMTWSIYAWYRILLPQLLDKDVHRVLYLDCDVIVNNNLDELFTMDMESKSIAACLDIQAYNPDHYKRLNYDSRLRYVCTGVLLMNLNEWRIKGLSSRIVDFAGTNRESIMWPDQDSINYVCREDKIILPSKYGVLVPFFREKDFVNEHLAEMKELIEKPAIIHYAGYQPWIYMKNKSIHRNLWWRTYSSLHAFPKIRYDYVSHFVKWWIKVILIYLKVIKPGSDMYVLSLYYHHPRIKAKEVYKLMQEVSNCRQDMKA